MTTRLRARSKTLPLLGITMGDPAGIGPEVVAKGLAGAVLGRRCGPIVIGSVPVMEQTLKRLKLKLNVVRVHGHDPAAVRARDVAVFDPLDQPFGKFPLGVAAANTGAASVAFIKKAVELAQLGCIDGMVLPALTPSSINMAGFHYPGHTELLADLTKTPESGMMIVGGPLKIMFVTTHIALADLSSALTQARR